MNECNDPDHGAINAERSESRGLRKAWIELDDKRQQLERELTAARQEIDMLKSKYADHHAEAERLTSEINASITTRNRKASNENTI